MKQFALLATMAMFIFSLTVSCGDDKKGKWATGDHSRAQQLNLDIDAVQKAFREAKGPKDFEDQVNKIYTGKEIISIAVKDSGAGKQDVSLYIDKDTNGTMSPNEKILTLSRGHVDGANKRVQYSVTGYGPYAGYYHPPAYYPIVGALTAYWIYRATFRPYYTPIARYSVIRSSRSTYRRTPAYSAQRARTRSFNQKNSRKFTSSRSKSGWGKKAKAGSWKSGSRKATGSKKSGWGSSSKKKSSWGSSRSRRSSGSRRRR
ncbi:MAG: hypothetical protein OEZ36_08365 [Spirochaetota bacterium]|nr:hypothetical protein [Spirochaetota bacterium]